jgi:hypothetical protein
MDARGKPEIKERWMNLAPVKDFCVVGEEGGGVVCNENWLFCPADRCSVTFGSGVRRIE